MAASYFLLTPLFLAVITLGLGYRPLSRNISLAGYLLLLPFAFYILQRTLSGEVIILRLGGWGAETGIVWVIDGLAALMLTLSTIISCATVWSAAPALKSDEKKFYYPLHHFLVFGVNGCFATGDLFNLFVFFEVMLLTSFVQMTMGGGSWRLRRSIPYILVNLAASLAFLAGIGLVYASRGTVNFAALGSEPGLGTMGYSAGLGLVFFVIAVKSALAPLFFWLPDSYPAAPAPAAALFAGLLTKVGVYAFYRLLPLLAGADMPKAANWLIAFSVATMVLGVLGALGRKNMREILSFHIISQVGYMVFALGLWTRAALAAGVFYIAHHMIVKTALFLVAGATESISKNQKVSGLALTHPALAAGFFLPAMALAGMPPLSGFWAKLFIVQAGFQQGAWVSTGLAVFVSLLTLASMMKIWNLVFWGSPSAQGAKIEGGMLAPPLLLAGISILIGLFSGLAYSGIEPIGHQLMLPHYYIEAVLNQGGRY